MEEASVAGESPDRSKQRESSAEPTPGSASPVPEARSERDPRLAVAREATSTSSQRGGVDTATKIFSIRELRAGAAEDGDTGGASGTSGAGGGSGSASGSGGGSGGGSSEAGGSGEADGSGGAREVDQADGASDAGEADGSREATVADVGEAGGSGGPESAEGGGVSDGGEGSEDVESADVAEGVEGTEAAKDADAQNPSAKGGPAGDARLRAAVAAWVTGSDEPEESAGSEGSDRSEGSDGREPAGAEAADDASELSTAEDAAKSAESAETLVVAARAVKGRPEGKGRPEDAETAAEAEEGSVSAVAADVADAGQDAGSEDAGTATDRDRDATADGPQDAVPGTAEADEAEAAADKITDARPEVTGAPEDAAPEDAAPKADGDADDEPRDAVPNASEDEPEDTAPDASVTEPEDAAPRTSEDHPEDTAPGTSEAEPEDAAPDASAAEPEDAAPRTSEDEPDEPEDAAADPQDTPPAPKTATTPESKAADGAPAPQAPPAPDDATRTGGAGGKTGADDGVAEAVDQPTAVFKAVRPAKPAVDQPTTTLKAPPAPKVPEAPAERTSKFVALKPLDEPRAPRAPRPDATRPVAQVGPERTTQQPLPPKPPLDLLAELTNTPPPPQTPVRTAIRRVKIWTPLVVLLAIVFAVVQALRPLPTPSLTLTAEDSYTFDGSKTNLPWPSEGQGWMDVNGIGTMGNFGKQTPVAIGSVAKAMTAYIVLKDHPLKAGAEGEKITVDATAEKEGGYDKDGESTLNTVKAGDVLTEKQALSAIMIPSANNIARLLARWDAGSEAAFIKKMNDTAKALGMTNTTYTDASGLKETTVSTAEDQVKLGNQLVGIQALMDITKLPSWVDPSGKKWTNYNRLVPYNNSLGIKTGTTTAAGGNLLFAATKEVGGETAVVVGAILGQHTAPIIDTVNAVSKTAMLAAQDAMKSAKILKKGDVVGYVDDQLGGHTPVVVTKDVAAVGWAGLKVKLSFAPDAVPHTAKAGTKVGTLTVGDGSGGAVKVPVALQKDLAEPALTAKLKRLG
ncbi:D-alanyl-D-alanine carboxypeptidase [Streptomyces hokutonensis]|uniref:serine-type D-Ala-D-Ala carboxypeptidase n=1 Tax=Streptomyces hokutonensis TaxID=1306990 RepID=A0ABW6LUI2_9ACTN